MPNKPADYNQKEYEKMKGIAQAHAINALNDKRLKLPVNHPNYSFYLNQLTTSITHAYMGLRNLN